jgi:hypothetical protein
VLEYISIYTGLTEREMGKGNGNGNGNGDCVERCTAILQRSNRQVSHCPMEKGRNQLDVQQGRWTQRGLYIGLQSALLHRSSHGPGSRQHTADVGL